MGDRMLLTRLQDLMVVPLKQLRFVLLFKDWRFSLACKISNVEVFREFPESDFGLLRLTLIGAQM